MNIDYYYGGSRIAGLSQSDAQTVAHACQYVDDETVRRILVFEDGQTYERFATAQSMLDYRNLQSEEDKLIWAPFHFLPGGAGDALHEKVVCTPNSDIAKDMVRHAIRKKNATNALHRLGITLHVYVDTCAHQRLTGTKSPHNHIVWLEGNDHDEDTWRGKLKGYLRTAENTAAANFLDLISGLGHGAALPFPDMPWAK